VGLGARNPLAFAGLALAGANQPRGADTGLVSGETLAGLQLDDLQLAVLSACETGLDLGAAPLTGEGGQTLVRALHVAGARNVVASLWKVPDPPTVVLMEEFYRRLWDAKKPLGSAEALRQAQLTVWRSPGLARIMHTLDPRESRGERNRMGSPNFRPSAIPEQPKQTALRRTPAKFPGRQEAQVSGAPRPPRAGKSCPSQSPTALQDRGCGWPRGCLALSVCSCRSGLRGVSFPVCL
jgi:hypothetical protein